MASVLPNVRIYIACLFPRLDCIHDQGISLGGTKKLCSLVQCYSDIEPSGMLVKVDINGLPWEVTICFCGNCQAFLCLNLEWKMGLRGCKALAATDPLFTPNCSEKQSHGGDPHKWWLPVTCQRAAICRTWRDARPVVTDSVVPL